MAMSKSAGSSRKPPEPSDSHDAIGEWMEGLIPALQPLVKRVDALIREEHPETSFALKWKKAYYGLPKVGWFIEMVSYDVSVNVVFLGGADYDEPPPLGDRGRGRYIKLTELAQADTPEMRAWIKQAGQVPGWEWPA